MKLDVLAIAAHPDDAELNCSGTIAKLVSEGKKVGILDLTKGELGTRGSVEIREKEAGKAAKILGIHYRGNVGLRDGFFLNDEDSQRRLITFIRELKPEIVLASALGDRHPDHGKAGRLISDSCFLSGLRKITTQWDGNEQLEWRPQSVYHYIQDRLVKPDFVVDISNFWFQKIDSIMAYSSQFYNPSIDEPETYISSPQYLKYIEARSVTYGHMIGTAYGEGFQSERVLGVNSVFDLI